MFNGDRTTTSVIWRQPAPPETLGKFAMLDRLLVKIELEEDEDKKKQLQAEIDELQKELPKAREYRFTVAAVNVMGQTKYTRYWSIGRQFVETTLGPDPEDEDDVPAEDRAERNRLHTYMIEWATILTCYQKVETRLVPYRGEIDDDKGWKTDKDPDWWQKPETYVDGMFGNLHERLYEACLACNPRGWRWTGRSHFLAESLAREAQM